MELKDQMQLNEIFERIRIKLNKQSKAISKLFKLIIILALMNIITVGIIAYMAATKPNVKAELDEYFDNPTEIAQLEENFELMYED
jgi:hypothetical protein